LLHKIGLHNSDGVYEKIRSQIDLFGHNKFSFSDIVEVLLGTNLEVEIKMPNGTLQTKRLNAIEHFNLINK
jgi:hypothetical protein